MALVSVLTVLAGSGVSACSPDDPVNQILSEAGLTCVDASGANSTAEQIADAQFNTPITDPATGETKTGMQTALEMAEEMRGAADFIEEHSREEIRQQAIEGVYAGVPDGGDAAFAAAVCDDVNVDLWDRLTKTNGVSDDTLATTPHFLRGMGRGVCSAVGDTLAEAAFKDQGEEAKAAALDPDAYKKEQLLLLDESLNEAEELSRDNPKLFDLELMRQNRDQFAATSADDIVANMQSLLRMQWLAVEHQCPDKSRYGFGPNCGEFNPYPDGDSFGILKVLEGDLSCDDAKTVIRWHYSPGEADPNSALAGAYVCAENGVEKMDDAPLLIECLAFRGNPDGSHFIVHPQRD